jgi:hypothetical protein
MGKAEPEDGSLKKIYQDLRRKMASEGIPFLNGAELDHAIAERKGRRFEISEADHTSSSPA